MIEVMELFGKEYEIASRKDGYTKFKNSPIFIYKGTVYTPRSEVPLSFAQTGVVRRIKMTREIIHEEETKEEGVITNNELVEMFKGQN